jgi:hypothetical protein
MRSNTLEKIMKKLAVVMLSAILSILLAAVFAGAQAAPKAPAKPGIAVAPAGTTAAPSKPTATPAPAAEPPASCACPACGVDGEQGPNDRRPGMRGHGMMKGSMGCEQDCPLLEASGLANVKVENTKLGATIQLVAKNAADVAKLQELARELTARLAQHPQPAALKH